MVVFENIIEQDISPGDGTFQWTNDADAARDHLYQFVDAGEYALEAIAGDAGSTVSVYQVDTDGMLKSLSVEANLVGRTVDYRQPFNGDEKHWFSISNKKNGDWSDRLYVAVLPGSQDSELLQIVVMVKSPTTGVVGVRERHTVAKYDGVGADGKFVLDSQYISIQFPSFLFPNMPPSFSPGDDSPVFDLGVSGFFLSDEQLLTHVENHTILPLALATTLSADFEDQYLGNYPAATLSGADLDPFLQPGADLLGPVQQSHLFQRELTSHVAMTNERAIIVAEGTFFTYDEALRPYVGDALTAWELINNSWVHTQTFSPQNWGFISGEFDFELYEDTFVLARNPWGADAKIEIWRRGDDGMYSLEFEDVLEPANSGYGTKSYVSVDRGTVVVQTRLFEEDRPEVYALRYSAKVYRQKANGEWGVAGEIPLIVGGIPNSSIYTSDDLLGGLYATSDQLGTYPEGGTTHIYAESAQQVGVFESLEFDSPPVPNAPNGPVTDLAIAGDESAGYALFVADGIGLHVMSLTQATSFEPHQELAAGKEIANGGVTAIAVGADNHVFVTSEVSEEADTVTVFTFDTDTLTLTKDSDQDSGGGGLLLGLDGVADAAAEPEFSTGQRFVVTAGAGASALVTFEVTINDEQRAVLTVDQGPNPRGLNGLGDGDPTGRATGVQSLAINPVASEIPGVEQTFYMVSPDDDAMYVLQRTRNNGRTEVVQLLKDGTNGLSGSLDEGLAGAVAVVVSPDGKYIYVAATDKGDHGSISIYKRVSLSVDDVDVDGLQLQEASISTTVFHKGVKNQLVMLVISSDEDGSNIYVSGPNGLEVFTRDVNTGGLTKEGARTSDQVADLKVVGDLAYGVEPSTDRLLVFTRETDGQLTPLDDHPDNSRLHAPRSVEVSAALDSTNGTLIPAGRFVYVASAGNNSISVFDEYGIGDDLIDGNLHHTQIVREGVAGTRGLEGVRTIQLSAEIEDSVLSFSAENVNVEDDSETGTITTELPHGLRTGQAVWFESTAEAPGIPDSNAADPNGYYYVRKIDNDKFQLATSESEARSGVEVVSIPASGELDGEFALHTAIPAGAFLYALGYDANAIAVFARDLDPDSPTVGQLTFMQVIRNRIGNNFDSGANFGLFQPNSIVAPTDDTSTVFVGSAFDPLLLNAPGGFVSLHNNPNDSPALPAVELTVSFGNMASLSVLTGTGDDNITVHTAPNSGGPDATTSYETVVENGDTVSYQAIPLTFQTGDGFDSLTLNDVAAETTANLGDGKDTFTLRTTGRGDIDPISPLMVTIDTGSKSDRIVVESVGPNQTVNIDSNTSPGDDIDVDLEQIDVTSTVTIDVSLKDIVKVEGTVDQATAEDAFQAPDSGMFNLTTNPDLGAGETSFIFSDAIFGQPVVAMANAQPNPVPEGLGGGIFTLDATGSTWDTTSLQAPTNHFFIQYAWDLNGDGLFTELVSDLIADTTFADAPNDGTRSTFANPTDAQITLSWEDLVDFGFADADVVGSLERRLPLRVTRIETDADDSEVARDFSDTEITVTVKDVLPTLFIDGDDAAEMSLGGTPYSLTLSATDPGNDQIVSWTVNWGDGIEDNFGSDPFPTHFYQKPGEYTISVTAFDDDGNMVGTVDSNGEFNGPIIKTVDVMFASTAVSAGEDYTILEGQDVTLVGEAFGEPDADSFLWSVLVNEEWTEVRDAGGVPSCANGSLELTWQQLDGLGIDNDGVFDVTLTVTYVNGGEDTVNNPVTVLTSPATMLTVVNVLPTANFSNSGPVEQAVAATVSFTNVRDDVDFDKLTFQYDFGDGRGFVAGVANDVNGKVEEPIPESVTNQAGSHEITGRVYDGTGFSEFQTTVQVDDLPPVVQIDRNQRQLIVNEGSVATLRGTFQNPGGGPVTFETRYALNQVILDSVTHTQDGENGTWTFTLTPDDGPGNSQTITIVATEGTSTEVSFQLLVLNVAPTVTEFPSVTVDESGSGFVELIGVSDSSEADRAAGFTYSYDFGDGNGFVPGEQTQPIPPDILTDDGVLTIRARIADKDAGTREYVTVVNVTNVDPTVNSNTLTVTPEIQENGFVTLEGEFIDLGKADTHSVQIDWGDGTTSFGVIDSNDETKYTITATHQYLDDALTSMPTDEDEFSISVTIRDDDGGEVSQTLSATVENVAPIISSLTVDAAVNEGDIATLNVSLEDESSLDTHTVTINWGDGQTDTVVTGGHQVIDFEADLLGNPLAEEAEQQVQVTNQFKAIGGGFTVSTGDGTDAVLFDSSTPAPPSADVTSGGSRYAADVPVSGGSGKGLRVDITQVDENGEIIAVVVTDPGSGYANGEEVTVEAGNRNSKLTLTIELDATTATPSNGGSGYFVDVPASGGHGSGLRVDITQVKVSEDVGVIGGMGSDLQIEITQVDLNGEIVNFVVTNPGSGYEDGQEVTVEAGDRNAKLTIQSNGTPALSEPGSGYEATGAIVQFNITDPGSDYVDGDELTVASGDGRARLTLTEAGNLDLGTPNQDFGGPGIGRDGGENQTGENDLALGNVLRVTSDNYFVGDVGVNGGSGSGLRIEITQIEQNGGIVAFKVTDPDAVSGYQDGQVVTVAAGDRNAALIIGSDGLPAPVPSEAGSAYSLVNRTGGQLTFEFDQLVRIDSVDLLDVDQPGGRIQLFDAAGQLIATTPILLAGNNSVQRVFINQQKRVDDQFVLVPAKRMEIFFADKAALARLDYTEHSTLARVQGDDLDAGRSFTIEHQYLDNNPTATPADSFTIHVTATDDDGGDVSATTTLSVNNVDPVLVPNSLTNSAAIPGAVLPTENKNTVTVSSTFTDPGVLDAHTLTIDWGDGSPLETQPLNANVEPDFSLTAAEYTVAREFEFDHDYSVPGVLEINVTLRDDDSQVLSTGSTTAFLSGVSLVDGVLYVIGTPDDNLVRITESESDPSVESGRSITVEADFPGAFEAGLDFADQPNLGDHAPHKFDAADVDSIYIRMIGEDDHDVLQWVGAENQDRYIVTGDTIFARDRAATLFPSELEVLELDGGQGEDEFFVFSTHSHTTTRLFGGHDSDSFSLGGDAGPVTVDAVLQPAAVGPHTLDGIQGVLEIHGASVDFSSRPSADGVLVPSLDVAASHDTVTVFNDASPAQLDGILTDSNLSGMAMSPAGVDYDNFEAFELLLGAGDDEFTVEDTADGMITAVHGGGGGDTITVNDRGNATLAVFGDTTQDGGRYTGSPAAASVGTAHEFVNAGDDVIDASGATARIIAYGGDGADTITGTAFSDLIAGGSGGDYATGTPRDVIYALAGDDLVLGDSGFNFDLASGVVTVVTVDGSGISAADPLVAGPDEIHGGSGVDILIGDLGTVTQVGGVPGILLDGGTVQMVETSFATQGGNDVILGGDDSDFVLGGSGNDNIDAGDDASEDYVIGDNGRVTIGGNEAFDPAGSGNQLLRLESSNPTNGGADVISTGDGNDLVFGGTGNDTIAGGAGDDILLGDHGRYDRSLPANQNFVSIFTTDAHGAGNDTIYGDGGDDFILGQQGGDFLFGGAGEDDITGGHNVLLGDDGNDVMVGDDGELELRIDTSGNEFYVLVNEGDAATGGTEGADVMLGDNGVILRNLLPPTDATAWERYPAPFPDVIRTVVRYDDIDLVTGDDTLFGQGGDDILHGQRGDDTIDGGDGDDELLGQLGHDTIYGGRGHDFIVADVGLIYRDFNDDGSPRVNPNGAWHRDVVLEETATILGSLDIDSAGGTGADPELAALLLETDLLLLVGVFDERGNRATAAHGGWDTEVILVDLAPAYDDFVDGGDGDDYVFGQRGGDTLNGGDDSDWIFGDGASNVSAFPTEKPHILNSIRFIAHAENSNVSINLPQGGLSVIPQLTRLPEYLDANTPVLFQQVQARLIPDTLPGFLDIPLNDVLPRSDDKRLRAYATIIPEMVYHTDVLPGADTIDGGDGDDYLVGDNATIYTPLVSGLKVLDDANAGAEAGVVAALGALSHSLRTLAIDYVQAAGYRGELPSPHEDVFIGGDTIQGGLGHDTIVGDDLLLLEDFQLGMPVDESLFAAAAIKRQTLLRDLETLANDLDFTVFEAHYQVLTAWIDEAEQNPPELGDPNFFDLYVGKDSIADDGDDNLIVGDQATLIQTQVGGGQFKDVQSNSTFAVARWDSVKALLSETDAKRVQLLVDRRATRQEGTAHDQPLSGLDRLPLDYDFGLFVGNDTILTGNGDDLTVGDFILLVVPMVETAPAADEVEVLDNAIHARVLDIWGYVTRYDHERDFDTVLSYYPHAFYGHRGVPQQEVAIHAGIDAIDVQDGDDMVFGDGISTFVNWIRDDATMRFVSDRPELIIKEFRRASFELAGHYTQDSSRSEFGDDVINGGLGSDSLYGQDGRDVMDGGPDPDGLFGGEGPNAITYTSEDYPVLLIGQDFPKNHDLNRLKDLAYGVWTAAGVPQYYMLAESGAVVASRLLPWQNPDDAMDVNASGFVSPLDVLLVMNDLNRYGARVLEGENLLGMYPDVSGDRIVSSVDLLLIVNYLNSVVSPGGAGEGESAPEAGIGSQGPDPQQVDLAGTAPVLAYLDARDYPAQPTSMDQGSVLSPLPPLSRQGPREETAAQSPQPWSDLQGEPWTLPELDDILDDLTDEFHSTEAESSIDDFFAHHAG